MTPLDAWDAAGRLMRSDTLGMSGGLREARDCRMLLDTLEMWRVA